MGLRFRKSISILPGVKLNFGKTGLSVSTGVPGFRKTFHSSGKVTTSVGIPGTGISYVTTKNTRKQESRSQSRPRNVETPAYETAEAFDYSESVYTPSVEPEEVVSVTETVAIDIHKVSDEEINWTEILVNATPPDEFYDAEMWRYYHEAASKVLSGDIDTYLKVIEDINPLSDLLRYGTGFEFGTDSPLKMEVEFQINTDYISMSQNSSEYQDYVCSVAIRIARDMFALLPVQKVVVHATDGAKDILSVCFDKKTFSKLKFNFIDTSNTVEKFECIMDFDENRGFSEIIRLEL